MTEYDVQRTAKAIVDLLLEDDRFVAKVMKASPRKSRMLTSEQVAQRLGVSQWTVRDIAPFIGGIKKGNIRSSRWMFEEEGLKERYIEYVKSKK